MYLTCDHTIELVIDQIEQMYLRELVNDAFVFEVVPDQIHSLSNDLVLDVSMRRLLINHLKGFCE